MRGLKAQGNKQLEWIYFVRPVISLGDNIMQQSLEDTHLPK